MRSPSSPSAKPAAAPVWHFDRSRRASPQVLEQLRDLIVSLVLAPGTVLSRPDLAEQFGLSQTPIRDALIKLGEEGLVDIYPQHATLVTRIDIGSAQQAHFLRQAIETEIVRTLAAGPQNPALIASLRSQIDVQAALIGEASYREFIAADQAFHRLMYVAAGVPELFELVRRRSGHVDRLRLLHLPSAGKQRAIIRDHRGIVDTIASSDPEAAQQSLRDHLSGTLSVVDEIRLKHPDYIAP